MDKISTLIKRPSLGLLRRVATILAFLILIPTVAFAQKGKVDEFQEDTGEVLSARNRVKDTTGKFCSLIKVYVSTPEGVADDNVQFSGDIVGPPTLRGTQYWVYVPTTTGSIKLESKTLKPLTVNFREYPDVNFQPNGIYVLEVSTSGPEGQTRIPTHSLRMNVIPSESTVYVDNKPYVLEDGRVDIPLNGGAHSYTVMCDGYNTQTGTVTMQNKHISLPIRLTSVNGAVLEAFKHGSGKYGFRDQNGKTIVKPEYDRVFQAGDLFWVVKKGKYGMFDNQGNHLAPFAYEQVTKANDQGVFVVKSATNHKYGIVDRQGHLTAPCVHDKVSTTSSSLIVLIENGRFGAIDATGQVVLPCMFDEITDFFQGYAAVQQNGKCGFINEEGQLVIPCIYDSASHFSGGRARVSQDGYSFYIDRNGNRLAD